MDLKLDGVVKFLLAEVRNDGIEGVLAALPGGIAEILKQSLKRWSPIWRPILTLQVITIIGMWMQ